MTAVDKQQLRRVIRQKRRNLTIRQQQQASHDLLRHIRSRREFIRARSVAVYLANDGEIDPLQLIKHCWKMGKKVYLPVLHPILHNRLWFMPYTPKTRLVKNIYRIDEPKLIPAQRHNAWAIDLLFLPLVAFDASGNRMGMGGGYYDRTFSYKSLEKGFTGPKLIGLAHEFQKVEKLPVENWDIPLDAIITDQACYPR